MWNIHRREFLKLGSLATAAMLVPRFLKAFEQPTLAEGQKVLVIIQLSGGNDGLNTVIPYRNDIYYANRPQLAIPQHQVVRLNDDQGLHPALQGLQELYDNGELAILNSVGYPNPDRSHFRSMDIWQTASDSNQVLTTGWVGRYLDAQCSGYPHPAMQAIEVDDTLSTALKGAQYTGLAVHDPNQLHLACDDPFFREILKKPIVPNDHLEVDYLYKVMAETVSSADYIYDQARLYHDDGTYPDTQIGKDLKIVASLILAGLPTRVYYLSLGSFDTHVNQHPQQQRLFQQLNDAILAFRNDLKKHGRFQDVMMMTFSEFGRRVSQNASAGTDHGTANCMFLISGGLKRQGILNDPPNLQDLDQGDLRYQIDFKQVYATLLHRWLETDESAVLGKRYTYLDFI
ncbi:MAG: DUF1501 domain-containing protein [Thermoflavifilum sp.]|nr:DUF1501 domain-containing protein [Thermoflavifilum sp.]